MRSITIIDKHGREIVQEDGFYIYYKDGVEVIRTQSLEVMEASAPEPVKLDPISRLQSLDKRKIYYYSDNYVLREVIQTAKDELGKKIDNQINQLECMFETGKIIKCHRPINRLKNDFLFNFHSSPIPQNFNTSLSFEDVSLTVAEDIWKKTGNVSVFWSGGIDSTTALVSLMMTKTDWKNHIEIYTTKKAIEEEYPFFYDSFLKDANVKIMQSDELYNKQLFDNKFVIDGNLGDWLWCCGIAKTFGENYNQSYESFFSIPQFVNNRLSTEIREYIQQNINLSPVPIKSVFDLCWWLTFTHRWDTSKMVHESNINDVNYLNSSNSFFDHELFQCWSMSNMDKKIKDTWKTYKWPARDLIYKFTGDNDYRLNKEQQNSMIHKATRMLVITDGTKHQLSDSREVFETCINLQKI